MVVLRVEEGGGMLSMYAAMGNGVSLWSERPTRSCRNGQGSDGFDLVFDEVAIRGRIWRMHESQLEGDFVF